MGLVALFEARPFFTTAISSNCRRSLSGLLHEARFFLALHCSSTATADRLRFLAAPCSSAMGLDFQPGSEPVNIGRPLDLQVGVWVLSVRCLSPIHRNDAYRRDGFLWIPHTCLSVYPCACHKGAVRSSTPYAYTSAPLLQFC